VATTADWQIELLGRNLLMGAGTSYEVRAAAGFGGLIDSPMLRTNDTERVSANGTLLGTTRHTGRVLTWRVGIDATTSTSVTQTVRTLLREWRPPSDGSEMAIDVRVPGLPETTVRFYGQPRAAVSSNSNWGNAQSLVEVDCEFFVSDPYAYGAPVLESGFTAGTFTVAGSTLGDVGTETSRVSLSITGSGGTPVLTNVTQGGVISFATALAAGTVAVVDLHSGTVTVGGSFAPQVISPASTWMRLTGGTTNTLVLSGGSSVDISYGPAYW
jgi:phage-related protein